MYMKIITRDTDYAVRALCYMAEKKGGIVTVSEIVNELKAPRAYLRKILQILNKKGILKSQKGFGGGFGLGLSPANIYVIDLIKIFQGGMKLNECMFKKKICPNRSSCRLREKLYDIENYVRDELSRITIEGLLGKRDTIRK